MKACRSVVGVFAIAAAINVTTAQESAMTVALLPGQLVEGGPRFLVETNAKRQVPLDAARTATLTRRLTLDLDGVSLREAVRTIAREGGFEIVFADQLLPETGYPPFQANGISVAAALTEVLLHANVDVVFTSTGSAALVRRSLGDTPLFTGVVAGRVTDSLGVPLFAATVSIDGTSLAATTREDGTYRIARVPPGTHTVTARRVGSMPTRASATVNAGAADVDFRLAAAPTALNRVVTTVTGQQRKVELGNTIGAIDVASMRDAQAITSLADLLNAQAPGVVVLIGAVPGTASRIRIRGQNSLSVSNDPIYVLDGVRITADVSSLQTGGTGVGRSSPSRLNDISPDEIENIEIVKGPSAATLYGTDAANGVIVITTKRGRPGPARWTLHAERGQLRDDSPYRPTYGLLGYTPSNLLQSLRRCRLFEIFHFDTLANSLSPTCTLVSAHSVDLARNDSTTWLVPAPRTSLGGQVSGGTNELRYFLSGDRTLEYGPYGLPLVDRHRYDSLNIAIRPEMERPSQKDQISLRSNLNAALSPRLDAAISLGLTVSEQRFPLTGNNAGPIQNLTFAPGFVHGPGTISAAGGWGSFGNTPGSAFRSTTDQSVNRVIATLTGNYRPLTWLNGFADVGIDLSDERNYSLDRAGENSNLGGTNSLGLAIDERARYLAFTSNVRGTAAWQIARWAQLRSSGGWQFVATNRNVMQAKGTDLGIGGETPGQGVNSFITNFSRPVRTMGMYVEEQLALRDRLYITGAVRTDQASAFGTEFQNAYYPKASISWIVSDEPFLPSVPLMDQLRLRASFGTSGVQPGLTEAITTYSAGTGHFMNTAGSMLTLLTTGNPDLKPERSREFETGFDSRWWDDRVGIDFTFYVKNTKDALFSQPTAASAGVPGYRTNIGGMQNKGVEYRVNAQLIDTRNYGVDFTFAGSNNQNKILDLGPVQIASRFDPNQPGRPVNAVYMRKVTWNDRNGDGYLGVQEVRSWGVDSTQYLGPSLDPVQLTFLAGVEFFRRRLRFQALIDRKDGAFAQNSNEGTGCAPSPFPGCRGTNDLHTSLRDQARGISAFFGNNTGYIESTSYTRLREVSLSYDLSDSAVRRLLHARAARLSAAGRNIWLWSNWTSGDPEQVNGDGANNNKLWSYGPPSYYMVRLSVTY